MRRRWLDNFMSLLVAVPCAVGIAALTSNAWAKMPPGGDDCAGLTGAAKGLCNAYCNAVKCPQGHPGQACQSLLKNWQKATGLPVFPCDAVCCECAGGARACATARRCQSAQCQIADRCEDGQCPEAQCCQCPTGGCTNTTPRNCDQHGCTPIANAICSTAGRCEPPPCEQRATCSGDCMDAATGVTGTCQVDPANNACTCRPPTPPPCEQRSTCGGDCVDAAGVAGSCQVDPLNNACTCVPPCEHRATCSGDCVDAATGVAGTCQLEPNAPAPNCTCTSPNPSPCAQRVPCGGNCTEGGVTGTCMQPAAGGPCVCQ